MVFKIFNSYLGKILEYTMDPRIVTSLLSAILFLVMASAPVFKMVSDLGVKNKDMSLVVRSALAGLLMYLSVSFLL